MKAFTALVHREFIEHRGAFLIAPLLLLAVLFGAIVLAFTVGRIDARFSGALFTVAPLRLYEVGFLLFGLGWMLYLLATLLFYCADGFAADKRDNAMLFWKSMPVSDFKMLLSKLIAALTILPGSIYGVALLSGVLLFGVAYVAMLINGTGTDAMLVSIIGIYGQVAFSVLVAIVVSLLWYLPFMALVGAIATAVGRWAIPVTMLLPAIIATLEWVLLGGAHPFAARFWDYLEYRIELPATPYAENWLISDQPFSGLAFASDLIANTDWSQVGYGVVFALLAILLASEYRRRSNAN